MPPKRHIRSLTDLAHEAVLKHPPSLEKFRAINPEHRKQIVLDAWSSQAGEKSEAKKYKKEKKQQSLAIDSKIAKKHSKVKESLAKSASREAQLKRGWKIDPINEKATAK